MRASELHLSAVSWSIFSASLHPEPPLRDMPLTKQLQNSPLLKSPPLPLELCACLCVCTQLKVRGESGTHSSSAPTEPQLC